MRLLPAQLSFFTFSKVRMSPPELWVSSDSELRQRWDFLSNRYFPDRKELSEYQIIWSARSQKRVLGSCNLTHKRVRIARAMDRPELSNLLDALIYHEMCHAVVGVQRGARRRVFHGRDFRILEAIHPFSEQLDLWIRAGGWVKAVRSYSAHLGQKRRCIAKRLS